MKYSIFILLFLIYSLVGVIGFFVARMMRRESQREAAKQAMGPSDLPSPSLASNPRP
jgi:hypothetical protein